MLGPGAEAPATELTSLHGSASLIRLKETWGSQGGQDQVAWVFILLLLLNCNRAFSLKPIFSSCLLFK